MRFSLFFLAFLNIWPAMALASLSNSAPKNSLWQQAEVVTHTISSARVESNQNLPQSEHIIYAIGNPPCSEAQVARELRSLRMLRYEHTFRYLPQIMLRKAGIISPEPTDWWENFLYLERMGKLKFVKKAKTVDNLVKRALKKTQLPWRYVSFATLDRIYQDFASNRPKDIILFLHGDAKGFLYDSHKVPIMVDFFTHANSNLRSLSIVADHAQETLDRYHLLDLKSPTIHPERLIFSPKSMNGELVGSAAKYFIRNVDAILAHYNPPTNDVPVLSQLPGCSVEVSKFVTANQSYDFFLGPHYLGSSSKSISRFRFPCSWLEEENSLLVKKTWFKGPDPLLKDQKMEVRFSPPLQVKAISLVVKSFDCEIYLGVLVTFTPKKAVLKTVYSSVEAVPAL